MRTESEDFGLGGKLLLGRGKDSDEQPVGYGRSAPSWRADDLLTYGGDAPLVTFSPTAGGKTSGPVVTNARTYPGQAIFLDVKGEIHRLSAVERRAMGQKVHVIDLSDSPVGLDSLNPLDVAGMLGSDIGAIARSIAAEMVARPPGATLSRDFFWEDWGETMLTTGITYLVAHKPEEARLSKLYEMFAHDDSTYNFAVLLDTVKDMHRVARHGFSSYLQLSERETRPSVLATALSYVRLFDSDLMKRVTDTTTIDLAALAAGEPMTIYIVVPPYRLSAYAPVLRLWLTGLMHLMTLRQAPPYYPTLLMVDEAGQLGRMESLLTAMTLMRGYGMKLWAFWQSAAQLEVYGPQAKTIIDNAGVVQVFGLRNLRAATEIAALLGGITAEAIMRMKSDEQLVMVEGGEPEICKQVRYYSDPMFREPGIAR